MGWISQLQVFVLALGILLVLDAVWLSLSGGAARYRRQLKPAKKSNQPLLLTLTYIFYVAGLALLAVIPGIDGSNYAISVSYAAVYAIGGFSLLVLPNLAISKQWNLSFAVTEWVWGISATIMTAGLTHIIYGAL